MSDSPLSTRLVQTLGITTTLILSGTCSAYSFVLVPRLLESPTPNLLRQWTNAFEQGKKTIPPASLISLLSYLYLAYRERSAAFPARWKVYTYGAAAFLAVSIVPYTLVFMKSTNEKLAAKHAEVRTVEKFDEAVEAQRGPETAHRLLDNWGLLNLGRGALLTFSGVLGLWTALN